MAVSTIPPLAAALPRFAADLSQVTVSGLSSGAFMTVQLSLAHSATFSGAGIIAGGPYRCVESFRGAAWLAEDAWVQNALFVCMNPLIPEAGPKPEALVKLAGQAARDRLIDPVDHVARQRLYLFTGTEDTVVDSSVVRGTHAFYRQLGVPEAQMRFVGDVPAGHAILTTHIEDNPLGVNAPPYISRARPGDAMQSHDILRHLLGHDSALAEPAPVAAGRLICFDQREYFDGESRASMSAHGWLYVPSTLAEGDTCRIHVVLHGCKQGANYVNIESGRADRANEPPFGLRYVTRTGYNEMAEANRIVVLYPQAEGIDDGRTQNPEGCWDWWGYSSTDASRPDYWSREAIQIRAIHRMVQRLGGG